MKLYCSNSENAGTGFLPRLPTIIGHQVTNMQHTNDKTECVFCDIADRAMVEIIDIEPLNPVVPGHRIVFARQHSTDFTDNVAISMRVMEHAAKLAKELGGDFNLITSKGSTATQTVFHLHVHLVPRKEGDGLYLPWTNQQKSASTPLETGGWEERFDKEIGDFPYMVDRMAAKRFFTKELALNTEQTARSAKEEVLQDFRQALLTEARITDYADETEYDIMCRFLDKWAKSVEGISLSDQPIVKK